MSKPTNHENMYRLWTNALQLNTPTSENLFAKAPMLSLISMIKYPVINWCQWQGRSVHIRTYARAYIWNLEFFGYYSLIEFVKVPVSTCTAERSLSSMERLKTPLQSTMTDGRLSCLAIFHIHKHKDVDIDDVITEFARLKGRRLALCLWAPCLWSLRGVKCRL